MPKGAPRRPGRLWQSLARGALLALCLWPGSLLAEGCEAWNCRPLVSATFTEPTGRYPHGVLGDDLEWGALELRYAGAGNAFVIRLPQMRVFEDLEPRTADVDGDGHMEVVVVESDAQRGARLAIYDGNGLVAATPFIGTRFRWLAPIGIGDLDGDGHVEIAYIDRPHLAKTLRVWRFQDGQLTQIASAPGFSNHRIGEDFISGGLRDCGEGPQMIVASGDWRRVISLRLQPNGALQTRDLGPFSGPGSFEAAMACKN